MQLRSGEIGAGARHQDHHVLRIRGTEPDGHPAVTVRVEHQDLGVTTERCDPAVVRPSHQKTDRTGFGRVIAPRSDPTVLFSATALTPAGSETGGRGKAT